MTKRVSANTREVTASPRLMVALIYLCPHAQGAQLPVPPDGVSVSRSEEPTRQEAARMAAPVTAILAVPFQGAGPSGPGMTRRISRALSVLLVLSPRGPSGAAAYPMARVTSRVECSP